jgi:hypothetical protein
MGGKIVRMPQKSPMSANAALRIAMLYLTLEKRIWGPRVARQATTRRQNWGQKLAFTMGTLDGLAYRRASSRR